MVGLGIPSISIDYFGRLSPEYPPVTSATSQDSWESLQALGFQNGQYRTESALARILHNASIYNEYGIKIFWGDLSESDVSAITHNAQHELYILNQQDSHLNFGVGHKQVDEEYNPGYPYVLTHALGVIVPENLTNENSTIAYLAGLYLKDENPLFPRARSKNNIYGFSSEENLIHHGNDKHMRRLLATLKLNKENGLNKFTSRFPTLFTK